MFRIVLAALLTVASVAHAGTGSSKAKAKATVKARPAAPRPAAGAPRLNAHCPPGCPPHACAPVSRK